MDFMPPDPEQMHAFIVRLRDIFQEAAGKAPASAAPLLESASDAFNQMADQLSNLDPNADPMEIMGALGPVMAQMQKSMMKLQMLAMRDPEVASILMEMQGPLNEAVQEMMGDGPSGGKLPEPRPKKPLPPNPPGPKKPGGGFRDI